MAERSISRYLRSAPVKRIGAIAAVLIIALASVLFIREALDRPEGEVLEIGDVLTMTSERNEVGYDLVEVPSDNPMTAVVAAPLACWYDISDGSTPIYPLLVRGSDGEKRFREYTGRGSSLDVSFRRSEAFRTSRQLALDSFSSSAGMMLVTGEDEGYSLALMAAPVASYLNIPIIVADHYTGSNDIREIYDSLGGRYTIAVGPDAASLAVDAGVDRIVLKDDVGVIDAAAEVVANRFGTLNYMTMTNPMDTEGMDVLEDVSALQVQDVDSVFVDTSSVDIDVVGESIKVHTIDVPEGVVNIRIYINFTDINANPLDPLKDSVGVDPLIFATLRDQEGRLVADAPSFSAGTGRNYLETLSVENGGQYELTVRVYYGVKGLSTLWGTSFGISRISGSYEVDSHCLVLGSTNYPLYEGHSMMAPYLSASRGGLVLSDGDFSLYNDEFMEAAEGFGTGPWYERELLEGARRRTLSNVGKLEAALDVMDEHGLKDPYLEGRGWLALLGGGNMIPMYYQEKDPSWEEDPIWGEGWATDLPYSLNLSLSVGRPLGRTVSDLSALLARTLFYEEYTEGFIDALTSEYGNGGSWKDHFHFLAGEGGGRTGWLFHQNEFARTVQQHGFISEVYVQDYENDRQTMVAKGAYERANYFEMILHGDWSWFVPELNGIDRYSTGVKVTDLIEDSADWELGPSVFNSGVCLLGRIGGLRPEQSITQAFFKAGINGFFCATRSTGQDAKAGPIEEALLFDDLSMGEAIRKDKRDNTAPPTYYVRTLYGDPAFNPYEPENGYSDQGRPTLLAPI